jgi:hypothetical protein
MYATKCRSVFAEVRPQRVDEVVLPRNARGHVQTQKLAPITTLLMPFDVPLYLADLLFSLHVKVSVAGSALT